MIILTETTDKIKVVLSNNVQTNQLHCYSSYRELTSNSIEPKRNLTLTNNTTPVDLVPSPSSSKQFSVDYFSIYNNDTIAATVSVLFEDNSLSYELFSGKLNFGDKLEYQDKIGFRTSDFNGSYKTSIFSQDYMNITATNSNLTVLTAAIVNSDLVANTLADVPGLSFSMTANSWYYFKFFLYMSTNASGNGCRLTITGPTFSSLCYRVQIPTGTTTLATFEALNIYDSTAPLAASLPTTLLHNSIVEGMILPSSDGNLMLRFSSEGAGTTNRAEIRKGSFVYYQKIN